MTRAEMTQMGLTEALRLKAQEIRQKPEYRWADGRHNHKVDALGRPAIKAAVANCALDFDLWQGLRNPALIGRHPAGLRQVWEFYAARDIRKTRPDGTPNYLSMPVPFEEAAERFGRALIVSAMVPLSDEVFEPYAELAVDRVPAPYDQYCKAWTEANQLIDETVAKVAMELSGRGRAAVPLTGGNVDALSQQAVPPLHQGTYHGPCKGGNFSHQSAAVLTGLAQFGVSRNVFRDEATDDGMDRFIGPVRTIVVFDEAEPVTDGSGGVRHLTEDWRQHVIALTDFTDTRPEINRQRYCTYIPDQELQEEGCAMCVTYCPSGAVGSSAPRPDGTYAPPILSNRSRFSDGSLQFNFAACLEERTQKKVLYPDFMCGRCVAVCAIQGKRRAAN